MAGLMTSALSVAILLTFHPCNSHSTDGGSLGLSVNKSLRFKRQLPEGCTDDLENTPGRPTNPSLRTVVPAGYDKYILPKGENNGPLPVYFSAKVRDIQKIDETNMELTIEWFLRMFWRDPGLIWPTHLPNGTWLNISPDIVEFVWLPTIFIDHVKEVTKPTMLIQPESFRMLNNGLIRYSISVTTRTSCPMDFSAYPFDSQVCFFKMESYQYTAKEVSYLWYDPKIERVKKIQSGQFDFDFYSVQQQNTSHQNRSFPTVMVEVMLNRRISYHLMNTFLPSGLFVMVSWLTFLVPVHMVPGRMVLTITTLLTMVSMFASVRQESPKVSYAKAVDQWMIMCIIFVFMVLFEFTVAIYVYEKAMKAKEKIDQVEVLAPNNQSGHVGANNSPLYTNIAQAASPEHYVDPKSDDQKSTESGSSVKRVWKASINNLGKISRGQMEMDQKFWMAWVDRIEGWSPLLFFLAFIVSNIAYWIYWMKRRGLIQRDS